MGDGSWQTRTAMLSPCKFHCLLDELPLHLIPESQLKFGGSHNADEPLFPNPHYSVLSAGELPSELEPHRGLLENFDLQGIVAWVRDPATSCLQPFWLGPRMAALVSHLPAGECVSDSVPRNLLLLLAEAGILVRAQAIEHRLDQWSEVVRKGAKQFRQKGYVPLRSLIHPFHVAALRRYYRQAIRRGVIHLGDEQSSRRYVAHNESVARFFHHQLTNVVSAIVGEAIKPSYVYFASYLSGAKLKKHTDREQCEFSVTLCLDFSPESDLATSWPIYLDTGDGTVAVYQALGDGLVYRGTKVHHYRSILAGERSSTSIFFHYVPADFSGPLD